MRLICSVILTTTSIILMGWGLWPIAHLVRQQSLLPEHTALPEARPLHLDFPSAIRVGEADRTFLSIEAGDAALAATSQDTYATYDVLAEARLDLSGMAVRPADIVSEPLLPGHRVSFFWSIRPIEPGHSTGMVWFYLRFIPKNGGPERRQAVSVQTVEIEAVTLMGLEAESVRWLGLVGVFFASLLGFPFLLGALQWVSGKTRAN